MVSTDGNYHVDVIRALLDTLFPALDGKAAKDADRKAEAVFLETSGGEDPRVAHMVRPAPVAQLWG